MMAFIEFEPAKAMTVSQYLGCAQKEIQPEEEDIERMSAAFENCSVERGDCSARVAHPELRKSQGDVMSTKDKVTDEAHSENIELDPGLRSEGNSSHTEGNTSRGNAKIVRDVLKHSNSEGRSSHKRKVKGYAYDMQGHTHASVERYLELAGKPVSSLQPVATPC